MNCQSCGSPIGNGERFCPNCGAAVASAPAVPAAPVSPAPKPFAKEDLPAEYRPLSPWAYFGLQILYAVPIVGFIFLIIFSFKSDNLNRRSFTRSYWCGLLILGILAVIAAIIAVIVVLLLTPRAAQSVSSMPGY